MTGTHEVRKKTSGTSLVELVMVMMMLAMFGATIYTLISAGADTQLRIMNQKDAQADARIALSYINVQLRQNDSEGKVAVLPIALTGENAIRFRTVTEQYEYDMWVYVYNGKLYECIVDIGAQPEEDLSFEVLSIHKLTTTYDAITGVITNTVYYFYALEHGAEPILTSVSSSVHLRSAV